MTLTKDEIRSLVDEYVSVRVNLMTTEEMASYVYNHMRQESICQRNHLSLGESLKEQIDEYDEDLYQILVDYVQDKPDSYTILNEYLHDAKEAV